MNDLDNARNIINEVDKEMAELFEKRMNAAKLVAEYKKTAGLPIYDKQREIDVIKKNSAYIKDDEIREYYINFLQDEMNISKKYQERLIKGMKVAYSGVKGAFGYIASRKMHPNSEYVSYKSFTDAYNAVVNGECDIAVLPVENSYAGDVSTVMDLIFSGNLYINNMLDLDVDQNLFGCPGSSKNTIKKVISHAQAIAQSNEFIRKMGYEVEECPNTAVAAMKVAELNDPSIGAIASIETAELYGLTLLESNINTNRNNTTRFAAFSRVLNTPKESIKMGEHFIMTFTVRNTAGALAKTLDIIGENGFNMRNVRSRPMKELLWNYYFYAELDGNINSPEGKKMLNELKEYTDRLKLVGSYYSYAEK